VQATGSALAAGYILNGLFAPDAMINTWQLTLLDLGSLKTGLSLRINSTFVLGAVILLAVKLIQDGGILRSANTTKIIGISAMIPLILIGVVPLFTGDIVKANFFPLVPLAHDALGRVADGTWNMAGITVFAAGMFLAAWSTYGFETAVCYTGEFKNPKTDTFKANISFDKLLKSALRWRPDRIIMGEVRGIEARTLLDSFNTGHTGSLATIHANSAAKALTRFANLVMRSHAQTTFSDTEAEIGEALDFVVHVERQDGRRIVREVLALRGYDRDAKRFLIEPVFEVQHAAA